MLNRAVIVSSAEYFDNAKQINPYYHKESIDLRRAKRELEQIADCLEQAGVTVHRVGAPKNSQDGVYTANWALVRGQMAVLARLPNARKAEEAWAERVLQEKGLTVLRVPNKWRFSGQGDALACGEYLFCGSHYRSDVEAQTFAADALGYTRIQLQTVPQLDQRGEPVINASSGWPDSFYYDIDLALAIIKPPTDDEKGLIAYCPEAFTPESRETLEEFEAVDKIIVAEHEAREAFACNLVSTGETVVMSPNAPQLQTELEARGLRTLTPEVSELAKGGGYIRCTSLKID